jgi:hypothetical protein
MDQWYKDGEVFNSLTAVRNKMKDTSLPMLLTDSIVAELGFIKVVDVKPTITAVQYLVEGSVELVNSVPTKIYAVIEKSPEQIAEEASAYMSAMVQHFTDVTTAYIEAKVTAYNKAHGLAFANIDAFAKYAINPLSQHYTIANQFINYADAVWKAVRDYQATATTIPTDVQFKVVLDSVVF